MTPYNAYWSTSRTFRNTGKLWTEEEKDRLRRMFCAGDKIETICEFLERPPEEVKAKLVAAKLIVEAEPTSEDCRRPDYYINPLITSGVGPTTLSPPINLHTDPVECISIPECLRANQDKHNAFTVDQSPARLANPAFPASPKEHPMKNIEQITLIDGQDASTLTDTQIFQKIAKLEKDMAMWKIIENRPIKLTKTITALQLDIDALVAYVDGR